MLTNYGARKRAAHAAKTMKHGVSLFASEWHGCWGRGEGRVGKCPSGKSLKPNAL